jgi:transcriptional regulator with XRE-family HTH domain
MTDFSDRVVAAREAKGLTQADLAEAIGMTQQGVAAIENGKSDRPKKLRELARVLGVSLRITYSARKPRHTSARRASAGRSSTSRQEREAGARAG